MVDERQKRIPQLWLWGLAGVALVGVFWFVFAVAPSLLIGPPSKGLSAADELNARNDVRTTLVQALAGLAVAGGLVVTYRTYRQNRAEQDRTYRLNQTEQQRAYERELHARAEQDRTYERELYAKAIEQLGHEKAPVRLGALYSLERLAQDKPERRQVIVNVICAYLRMPFSTTEPIVPTGKVARDLAKRTATEARISEISDAWQQERQVRLTAQRILADHLRDDRTPDERSARPPGPRFWPDIGIDLTSATLVDFALDNGVVADANFGGATFSGGVSFGGATFSGSADFRGAAFSDIGYFSRATFSGDAEFEGAIFNGMTLFEGATFNSYAGFRKATFSGKVGFDDATFNVIAWFSETTFSSDADFEGVTFNGDAELHQKRGTEAWFDEATFSAGANFSRATFGGDATFEGAIFNGNALFSNATFGGRAYFRETIFNDVVMFPEATFSDSAVFGKAAFSGHADFSGAVFNEVAGFVGTVFRDSARFDEATFGRDAMFDDATLTDDEFGLSFERSRVLSSRAKAKHVWPRGWCLGPDGSGEYTVVRASGDASQPIPGDSSDGSPKDFGAVLCRDRPAGPAPATSHVRADGESAGLP